jgi:hypothetical protein
MSPAASRTTLPPLKLGGCRSGAAFSRVGGASEYEGLGLAEYDERSLRGLECCCGLPPEMLPTVMLDEADALLSVRRRQELVRPSTPAGRRLSTRSRSSAIGEALMSSILRSLASKLCCKAVD